MRGFLLLSLVLGCVLAQQQLQNQLQMDPCSIQCRDHLKTNVEQLYQQCVSKCGEGDSKCMLECGQKPLQDLLQKHNACLMQCNQQVQQALMFGWPMGFGFNNWMMPGYMGMPFWGLQAQKGANTIEYVIQKGDTLRSISQAFHITPEEVSQLNPTLPGPENLKQKLPHGTIIQLPAQPQKALYTSRSQMQRQQESQQFASSSQEISQDEDEDVQQQQPMPQDEEQPMPQGEEQPMPEGEEQDQDALWGFRRWGYGGYRYPYGGWYGGYGYPGYSYGYGYPYAYGYPYGGYAYSYPYGYSSYYSYGYPYGGVWW